MPTYDFCCQDCGTTAEHFFKMVDCKPFVTCAKCGGSAKRILACKILRVEPTWLESSKLSFPEEDRAGIRDRNDLHRYMKQEGISQIG